MSKNLRTIVQSAALAGMAGMAVLACLCPRMGHAQEVKYYFKISNVVAQDTKVIPIAKELLEREVQSRPELTTEPGDSENEAASLAALKRRGIESVLVSMRITSLKKQIKDPAPGKRDQQMSIDVKLSIFGHTLPGNKVLFTGDGESSLTGDFSERLKDKEEERFTKAALEAAIRQAVATGVDKLTHPVLDAGKPGKAKKAKGNKGSKDKR